MKLASFIVATAFAVSTLAIEPTVHEPTVQLETGAAAPPAEWQLLGRADPKAMLELMFAVKQTNVDELERVLQRVSDPRHADYGQHLSNDAVHALVAPLSQDLESVRLFLASHGVEALAATPNSDFVSATVCVHKAEQMLGAEYYSYRHPHLGDDHIVHRASRYALPESVAAAVDFVSPTVHFPPVRMPVPAFDTLGASKGSNLGVSAKKLRTLYSVDDTVGGAAGNRHAVTGFLKQHFHPKDLAEFWSLSMGGVNASAPTVKEVGDLVEGGIAGTESMLDIEYINAMGAGIESEFWGFSGNSPDNPQNEPFIKWLAVVSNTSDDTVPLIFSTSYGEPEDSTTMETATRTNAEFMKAGARGISLLFASGDSGAGPCTDNKFTPNWPAGSPYVTGVGGTSGTAPESAAGLSSGGFCNRWAVPTWQKEATAHYLSSATGVPPASYFNASGRGFPDISAQATGFTVVANLIPLPGVAGTSCASPTASGVMALLNDLRVGSGKAPLGFLNPFIYQNAASFNDITTGSNGGCGIGQSGYPAAAGWDPVTGVGTPNYAKLSAAVKALP